MNLQENQRKTKREKILLRILQKITICFHFNYFAFLRGIYALTLRSTASPNLGPEVVRGTNMHTSTDDRLFRHFFLPKLPCNRMDRREKTSFLKIFFWVNAYISHLGYHIKKTVHLARSTKLFRKGQVKFQSATFTRLDIQVSRMSSSISLLAFYHSAQPT